MKNITLAAAINFQEIFLHDGVLSPYEFVDSWETYHPLVIIGEIGTLINNRCKSVRSPNEYAHDIENDCADIFISLLILGMLIERETAHRVFAGIKKEWKTPAKGLKDEESLVKEMEALISKTFLLTKAGKEKCYTTDFFLRLFRSMKEVSVTVSGKSWQEIMNTFHTDTLEQLTSFDRYTPDLWYRGSCFVHFGKLLFWLQQNEVALPQKRLLFLERMRKLQEQAMPEA
ncbi:MAG: hypothetical protein NT108_01835 [Candidatus Kaiserbacteria bacterium]|nr:hypothetical protein [Candidatus Kaiserbacteria bacterium]